MSDEQFNSLIKSDKYQVFLFSSPCSLPISFVKHTWLVTNAMGRIHRFEVWSHKKRVTADKGHMTIDFYPPTLGVVVLPIDSSDRNITRFKSKVECSIEGDAGSVAQKMVEFLENSYSTYPYLHEYHFVPGPNSNTFIQWVLDKFPRSGLKLPNMAFGKGYKII